MRSREPRRLPVVDQRVLWGSLVAVLLLVVLVGGYVRHWEWTGYRATDSHKMHTLWDWLEVTVLPVAVALTPAWLATRRRREWRLAALLTATALALLALGGYVGNWGWTGFTGNTLFDWLGLFLVPCALPITFALVAARQAQGSGPAPDDGAVRSPGASDAAGSRASRAVVGVVVGAVALLLLGVGAALLTRAHTPEGSDTSAPPRAEGAAAASATPPATGSGRWVVVDSQDPYWTDTGVQVHAHERVLVSASGRVSPSKRPGYDWAPPAGLATAPAGHQSIDPSIPHAALVAMVGTRGETPRLDHTAASTKLVRVGGGPTTAITTRRAGELFLGLNDTVTEDNRGMFEAVVRTSR